jgi:para-nitrobenzyl esterase
MRALGVWPFAVVLGALSALAGCGSSSKKAPIPSAEAKSRRTLGSGEVTGFVGPYGSHVWLGLRYAKAPKGALRFKAPELLEPSGAQEALTLGAPCPQIASPFGVNTAEPGTYVGDEDCLFLNVYAPAMSAEEAAGARLPVMVWFHGGGNVVGHAGGYDGGNLARQKRVVVVMANYRLGPLGWFRHASLRENASPEDASGNYGTLDLIASLRWVQKHVAAFGGNPGNVTILGESAGARDVLSLVGSPLASGLFHRAIAQSGNVRLQDSNKSEALRSAGGFDQSSSEVLLRLLVKDGKAADAKAAQAALAGMSATETAAYLRGQSAQAMIEIYSGEGALQSVPNVFDDGAVLRKEPLLASFARPDGHQPVPVMLGTNRDENKTFMLRDPRYVRTFTPLYLRMRDPDRYQALASALSLGWKVAGADAPAAALAQSGGEAFVYRFDWDEEPTLLGADLAAMLGAGHGFEIPFVFGHFDLGPRANVMFTKDNAPGRHWLAQRMMAYWAEFARTGKPGTAGGRGPEWPAFRPQAGSPQFLVFDTEQDRGIRLQQGLLDMNAVLAGVDKDERLRTPEERCEVLREVVRSSPLLDPQVLDSRKGGACKVAPLTASR